MSSDARIWQDETGDWHASHDGGCVIDADVAHPDHVFSQYGLSAAIASVEKCMGQELAWRIEEVGINKRPTLFGWQAA